MKRIVKQIAFEKSHIGICPLCHQKKMLYKTNYNYVFICKNCKLKRNQI